MSSKAQGLGALGWALAVATVSGGVHTACGNEYSYVVVALTTPAGRELGGIRQIEVVVRNNAMDDRVVFQGRPPGSALRLVASEPVTFSVSLPDAIVGQLEIEATPRDGERVLGYGMTSTRIQRRGIARVALVVDPDARPPTGPLACVPTNAATCSAQQTCSLQCRTGGTVATRCVTAGAGGPGTRCVSDLDCAPGTQCFTESCGISICRRFCDNAEVCGPGAACVTEIQCTGAAMGSGTRICSQPCDPRGEARTGCAEGLHCLIFSGGHVDCDCAGTTRTRGDGEACAASTECAPGLLCVLFNGQGTCRPICRLDTPTDCATNRRCDRLTTAGFEVYGACVPAN